MPFCYPLSIVSLVGGHMVKFMYISIIPQGTPRGHSPPTALHPPPRVSGPQTHHQSYYFNVDSDTVYAQNRYTTWKENCLK